MYCTLVHVSVFLYLIGRQKFFLTQVCCADLHVFYGINPIWNLRIVRH